MDRLHQNSTARRLCMIGAAGLVMAGVMLLGGCAHNVSSTWAQTSPLIKAEPRPTNVVSLGTRGR